MIDAKDQEWKPESKQGEAYSFIKKVDKVPKNEIERAVKIKIKYFENKPKNRQWQRQKPNHIHLPR